MHCAERPYARSCACRHPSHKLPVWTAGHSSSGELQIGRRGVDPTAGGACSGGKSYCGWTSSPLFRSAVGSARLASTQSASDTDDSVQGFAGCYEDTSTGGQHLKSAHTSCMFACAGVLCPWLPCRSCIGQQQGCGCLSRRCCSGHQQWRGWGFNAQRALGRWSP